MVATIELPFKPFTFEEVQAVTGVAPKTLDAWTQMLSDKPVLPVKHGLGVTGLDYVGCFAVYVGHEYLKEGAPPDRATAVVRYLGGCSLEYLGANFTAGRTFPVPRALVDSITGTAEGMLVTAPDSTLGRRLRLDRLLGEFRQALDMHFGGTRR